MQVAAAPTMTLGASRTAAARRVRLVAQVSTSEPNERWANSGWTRWWMLSTRVIVTHFRMLYSQKTDQDPCSQYCAVADGQRGCCDDGQVCTGGPSGQCADAGYVPCASYDFCCRKYACYSEETVLIGAQRRDIHVMKVAATKNVVHQAQ